ncbi:MAG: SDR family NAD(P)-dependent oxidoreductase [Candidatus Kapabacteria bacterium]|nr:SDR family NAD(P)-dependent oxidoreductase [Candidatus Kapabacteria bacterium]
MQITRFERGLHGRVAIVTGAAIGNGRAFCERLAEEGAKLVIADLEEAVDTERAVLELGGEVVSVRADMTNPVDVERVVLAAIERFGCIDILVHNVGHYSEEPFELLTFAEWKKTLEITLDSIFHTVRSVLPHMKKAGFGRIITFSSDTVWLGTPYLTHYVTAKMGVIGFTRSLAAEVGKFGITVNTITVGLTATQSAGTSSAMSPLLEHIIPAQAVHRADEPEDIANVVAFLALPASGIITGQTINVDGGVARH